VGDTLTQLGIGGILAVLILKEVLPYVVNAQKKSSNGSSCRYVDPELAKLRTLEISNEVSERMNKQLAEQTVLLRDIRDAVRR
jgi:hypothetical protein